MRHCLGGPCSEKHCPGDLSFFTGSHEVSLEVSELVSRTNLHLQRSDDACQLSEPPACRRLSGALLEHMACPWLGASEAQASCLVSSQPNPPPHPPTLSDSHSFLSFPVTPSLISVKVSLKSHSVALSWETPSHLVVCLPQRGPGLHPLKLPDTPTFL